MPTSCWRDHHELHTWVLFVWNCCSSGKMATVKLDAETLAMNEKRHIVPYVEILAGRFHCNGSLGSFDGVGSKSAISMKSLTCGWPTKSTSQSIRVGR